MLPQLPFDMNDPRNMGRPIHWDENLHARAIIQMIQADEIQEALRMLENPPAWYRENYPAEFTAIKNKLYQRLYSQIEYASDQEEVDMAQRHDVAVSQWNGEYCFPRAQIITDAVKKANDNGMAPFIVDLGCSHGNLPLGLKAAGLRFNYLGLAMNQKVIESLRTAVGNDIWSDWPSEGQEAWLVCTEVLEHCMDPHSLVIDAYKPGLHYAQMFWSVPYGCLGGGLENWDRRLGHVRGWTRKEFSEFVDKHFPGYQQTLYMAHSMVLHGVKI